MQRKFTILLPEEVEANWPDLVELLEPAVPFAHGELDSDDILTMVKDKRAFVGVVLWENRFELALVGEIIIYPKKKVLNILSIGGRNLEAAVVECLSDLKAVAKTLDCDGIRGYVRPAIERLVKRSGGGFGRIYAVIETGV